MCHIDVSCFSFFHVLCRLGKTLFKPEQDRGVPWKEAEDRISSGDRKDPQSALFTSA